MVKSKDMEVCHHGLFQEVTEFLCEQGKPLTLVRNSQ